MPTWKHAMKSGDNKFLLAAGVAWVGLVGLAFYGLLHLVGVFP